MLHALLSCERSKQWIVHLLNLPTHLISDSTSSIIVANSFQARILLFTIDDGLDVRVLLGL